MELAKIPSAEAAETISRLMAMDLVDRSAKISKSGEWRLVPIAEGAAPRIREMGYEVTEGEAHSRERLPPQERIRRALSHLPEDVRSALPMRWEFVGNIAIIKHFVGLEGREAEIGEAYAGELGARTVCVDMSGVSGELRVPDMKIIFGTETEAVRRENGILFRFDVTKVMFSSGNIDERERMEKLDCTGETVVDMFAGIGYFTLPLARFANPDMVIAVEKNLDAFEYLVSNIEENGVSDRVTPVLGDNRDMHSEAIADRVLMGYVQKTREFIPYALRMIKPGGIIHYHDTFYVNGHEEEIRSIFAEAAGDDGFEILGIREVKSFAPSVSHYVADVRMIRPSPRTPPR